MPSPPAGDRSDAGDERARPAGCSPWRGPRAPGTARAAVLALAATLGFAAVRNATRADAPAGAKAAPLYAQDFEKAADGDVPSDMVVLNGAFVVKAEEGAGDKANRVVELPGDPVGGFGFLFGPAERAELGVSARVRATASGRRYPEFGVGLGDSGGYKLFLVPAVGELQLSKGEEVVSRAKAQWKPGGWTSFRLRVRKRNDGTFVVEGRAWAHSAPEPAAWAVAFVETEAPQPGHASAWGSPYSGTPIQFDDLVVTEPGE